MVVLVAMMPSISTDLTTWAMSSICASSKSGAILTASGTYLPCAAASCALFVFQGFQQCAQFVAALLKAAQVFRIGGGNIDRNVARVGVGFFQANQIIVGRIFNRRNGIFADVDAQNAFKRLFSMLRIIASMPWLLKPMRLMMPWCSGTRKRRG